MDRSSRIRLDDDYPICVAHLVSIERADAHQTTSCFVGKSEPFLKVY